MHEDDVAQSLIAALADQGQHVDDGRFTLDPAVAFRKLREHQLDDPHRYVLLLIEAAWLAAKTLDRAEVRVELGPTTVVEFTGMPLARNALRELFSAALGRPSSREGRILQLLGLAANSALALEPKRIVIEASDAEGTTQQLRLEPSGALELEPGQPSTPGQIRFMFVGRVFSSGRTTVERELLEQHCRFTRLGVRVNHHLISRRTGVRRHDGSDPVTGKPKSTKVTLEGRAIGIIGPPREPDGPSNTWIVNRGVAIADPPSAMPGLQAVVELDLPMDLARKQLLQGPELEAVRAAIREARARVADPVRAAPKRKRERDRNLAVEMLWLLPAVLMAVIATCMLDGKRGHEQPSPNPEPVQTLNEWEQAEVPNPVASDLAAPPREVDRESLRRMLVHHCYHEAGPACLEAAWYYHYGFIDPEAHDVPETDEATLLARACEAGVTRACRLRSVPSLREACDRDADALACYGLGLAGHHRDAEQQSSRGAIDIDALAALDRACELDLGDGCFAAGVVRLRGLAWEEDLVDAQRWFARGCARRHTPSCDAMRFTAERRAIEPDQRSPLEPEDPSFPRPRAPKGSLAWTP